MALQFYGHLYTVSLEHYYRIMVFESPDEEVKAMVHQLPISKEHTAIVPQPFACRKIEFGETMRLYDARGTLLHETGTISALLNDGDSKYNEYNERLKHAPEHKPHDPRYASITKHSINAITQAIEGMTPPIALAAR